MNSNSIEREKHPSYGTIEIQRINNSREVALFGSSVKHYNAIRLKLRRADVMRDLSADWTAEKETIAIVDMSFAQFTDMITSINVGTGTPVTIRYLKDEGEIDSPNFISKGDKFVKEFKDNLKSATNETTQLINSLETLFEEKNHLTKADRQKVLESLSKIERNLVNNNDYVYSQFEKQMEKSVDEAKKEVESFSKARMESLISQQLVDRSKLLGGDINV